MVRQEAGIVTPASETHDPPQEETAIPRIVPIDEIINAVSNKFEINSDSLFNKNFIRWKPEGTICLAQSALIHLLTIATVPTSQTASFLNLSDTLVYTRLNQLAETRRESSWVDDNIRQLEDELPWVREALDYKKTAEQIREVVEFYSEIPWNEIVSSSREKSVVRARNIAMYLFRESGFNLVPIGKLLVDRYHSTVNHGLSKLEKDREKEAKLGEALPILENGVDAIARRQELKKAIERWISDRETMKQTMIVVFEERLGPSPDSNS